MREFAGGFLGPPLHIETEKHSCNSPHDPPPRTSQQLTDKFQETDSQIQNSRDTENGAAGAGYLSLSPDEP